MNTHLFRISDLGTDLSNRQGAASLRARIISATAESAEAVALDFTGVRTISDSFADELFGVLAIELGPEWIRSHLSITNLSPDIRQTILEAVQFRIDRQEEQPAPC